ncbi:MAG TPA: CHAT domain-containing tetratricopeptide repeat protein, partial [Thermosynechococcaceae cyanobacterium]
GVALGNLGNAYYGAGLYVKAIEIHQKRLDLARTHRDRQSEGKANGDLGLVYQALGQFDKAIDFAQRQLTIAQQTQDSAGQKMALANLGIAYHELENYSKAIEFQQQRLTLAQQTKDLKAQAEALANLAGEHYFLGEYDRAISLYEQAWKIAWENLHDADVLYGLRGNQGLAYFQQGNTAKALELYQQSFTYLASRNNQRGQGVVKNNVAVLRWQSGDLVAAERALREAIEFWEALRSRLGSNDGYKVSIFETQNAPYLNLQSVLLAQNKPEAALEIAERGRARAFAELLERRQTSATAKPAPPPTIQQLQQVARDQNSTLVEYSILSENFSLKKALRVQESEVLIWVIQPTGQVSLRRSNLKPLGQQNASLATLVAQSRESIGLGSRGTARNPSQSSNQPDLSRSDLARPASLRQLHQILIEPIADLLPDNPSDSVVFVPQRSLFLAPFPALKDATGKYLIEKHTLRLAPSLQVLNLTHQQRQTSTAVAALIVGNPTMPKVSFAAGEEPEQLPNLPGAEQEARAIATLFNTSALTGDEATKSIVVQRMKQAKIIHLATHGLLHDFAGLGMPGAVALAPDGSSTGLLSASEILDLKLNAELVVLSACDTGRGKITGDGVIGLSRSLIAAGAPSVVVSLWAVPDAPTAALMTEFYRNLKAGVLKDQALRQAMVVTLRQYPAPRDWAAFVLIGLSAGLT